MAIMRGEEVPEMPPTPDQVPRAPTAREGPQNLRCQKTDILSEIDQLNIA